MQRKPKREPSPTISLSVYARWSPLGSRSPTYAVSATRLSAKVNSGFKGEAARRCLLQTEGLVREELAMLAFSAWRWLSRRCFDRVFCLSTVRFDLRWDCPASTAAGVQCEGEGVLEASGGMGGKRRG